MFGEKWEKELRLFLHSPEFNRIGEYLNEKEKYEQCFPLRKNIFNAFKFTDPSIIKVVFIGEKPYMSTDASGLCYGMENTITKSIENFYREMERDTDALILDIETSMRPLAAQGILMLNRSLTSSYSGSHEANWTSFLKYLIEYLMLTRNDLIFVLFGKGHERYENYIKTFSGHTIMRARDPSTKEFNGSGIFSKINAALYMMGKEEIKWYTPNYS